MKKILFLLLCSSHAFASNLRFDTDIAVDVSTGVSYFVEKENNPLSLVTVYDAKGEVVHAFSLSNGTPAKKTEIELVRPGLMLVVQQYEEYFTIRKFEKNRAEKERFGWQPEASSMLSHGGVANSLEGYDENYIVLKYTPVGGTQTESLLLSTHTLTVVNSEIPPKPLFQEQAAVSKPEPVESKIGGIGLAAGTMSGIGFAYRRHFENKMGMQFAGIWSADDNSSFSNIGGQFIRTVSRNDWVRFFAMAGAGVYSKTNNYPVCRPIGEPTRDVPPEFQCDETFQRTRTLNFGGGIGFEFMFGKSLGITVELPLTWKYDKNAPQGVRNLKGPSTIPAASIVYYFPNKKPK